MAKNRKSGAKRPASPPRTPAVELAAARTRPFDRVDALWLAVLFVLALALRLVYIAQLQSSPWFDNLTMDALFHHRWATAIATGQPFEWADGPYFRAPLYTWFLGAIYRVFGADSTMPARVIQALLGAVNVCLVYLVGRTAFNRRVAVLAGLGAATYWILLYYDADLLSPVLIVFFNLVLLLALFLARDRRSRWLWGLAGVALGLSAITRPDILLLAPLIVVWIFALYGFGRKRLPGRRAGNPGAGGTGPQTAGSFRRALASSACVAAGSLLVVLPVTIRNYAISGRFVLIGTYGGVNFFIGNNPGADGLSAVVPGDPPEWEPCYRAQVARAEAALGHEATPVEVSRWYTQQTWRYIAEHPTEAIGRMFRKAGYFWTWWEVGNNQDIYFITRQYAPLATWLPLGFWIIGPLGFAGLVLSLGRPRALFPLWGLVGVYLVVVALFFATARFRVPAVVVLIILAAYAVDWMIRAVRTRHFGRLMLAGVAALAIVPFVVRTPPGLDVHHSQAYRYAGFTLAKEADYDQAAELLREAVLRMQQDGGRADPLTLWALGHAYRELGRLKDAYDCFGQVQRMAPGFRDTPQMLAGLQAELRRAGEGP